jgi:hypothetical protein
MRTILIISVLALAMLGCAGNGVPPSNGGTNGHNAANKGEDSRCKEFSNFVSYALNAHVMPTNIEDGLDGKGM